MVQPELHQHTSEFTTDDSDLGSHSDEAHSVFNTTNVAWVLYDDKHYDDTDRHFCVRSGVSHPDLGGSAYKFGDKISSVRRLASNNCTGFPQITQG